MPDSSPDLPPVGELVRITTTEGEFHLAHLTPFINDRDQSVYYEFDCIKADNYVPTDQIASWNRLLVLPADELVDRLAARHWSSNLAGEISWEHWQQFAQRYPNQADRYRALVSGDVAALREAAIR